jgi:hypothetical protein
MVAKQKTENVRSRYPMNNYNPISITITIIIITSQESGFSLILYLEKVYEIVLDIQTYNRLLIIKEERNPMNRKSILIINILIHYYIYRLHIYNLILRFSRSMYVNRVANATTPGSLVKYLSKKHMIAKVLFPALAAEARGFTYSSSAKKARSLVTYLGSFVQ